MYFFIDVNLEEGTSYTLCSFCGKKYEIVVEISLIPVEDEEGVEEDED
jgi:hypothetical protein